jgi:cell division protein FtsX
MTPLGPDLRGLERLKFVLKEASLEAVRKKHSEEVGDLPTNPFPDALAVIPKRP